LEARGVLWHITDSGEPYRVVWLRRNGEYFYNDTTRDKRAGEELTTLRERRVRLGKVSAIAAVAIIVWLRGQTFIETFYPVLSAGFVSFLQTVLPISVLLVFFFVVIPQTVGVISALLDELVYRSGAQFIAGAKVLEPGAWRLGRQNVEQQKAHGDADFVTAEEAVRRMFRPGDRKPIWPRTCGPRMTGSISAMPAIIRKASRRRSRRAWCCPMSVIGIL
jgi:hypothetical protein